MILRRITSSVLSLAMLMVSVTSLPFIRAEANQVPANPTSENISIYEDKTESQIINGEVHTLEFYDGDEFLGSTTVVDGNPANGLPEADDKVGMFFAGWFTDPNFTAGTEFYATNPVESSFSVYARYTDEPVQVPDSALPSISRDDLPKDYSFEVKKLSTAIVTDYSLAIVVESIDGISEPEVTYSEANGIITVRPVDEYRNSGLYKVSLADGYVYLSDTGEEHLETTKVLNFSIEVEEINNVKFGHSVVSIPSTNISAFTVDGEQAATLATLTAAKIAMDQDGNIVDLNGDELAEGSGFTRKTGTVTVSNSTGIEIGSILAIHLTEKSIEQDPNAETAFIKVTAFDASTGKVTWIELEQDDVSDIFFAPQTLTISTDVIPQTNGMIVVDLGIVDLPEDSNAEYVLDKESRVNQGFEDITQVYEDDIIMFYNGILDYTYENNPQRQEDTVYGKITRVDVYPGTDVFQITYVVMDGEELAESYNSYTEKEVTSEELEEVIDEEAIITAFEEDFMASGYLEVAQDDMLRQVIASKETQELLGYDDSDIYDENGVMLPTAQLMSLSSGLGIAKSIFIQNIDVDFDITTDRNKLIKFNDGAQLSATVSAAIFVSPGDHEKPESGLKNKLVLRFDVELKFIQELSVGFDADLVFDHFMLIPKELKISADFDIKTHTAIDFGIHVTSIRGGSAITAAISDGLKNGAAGLFDDAVQLYNQAKETNSDELMEKAKAKYAEALEENKDLNTQAYLFNDVTLEDLAEQEYSYLEIEPVLTDLLTTESTSYAQQQLDTLINHYSDIVQSESDWAELLREELFKLSVIVYGIEFSLVFTAVISINVNVAAGISFEYTAGKRYSFTYDVLRNNTYTSETDLVDEETRFTFYIMGTIGIRAGIEIAAMVGIVSHNILALGIYGEVGVYFQLWGYYIYVYEQVRKANTNIETTIEEDFGAMYYELGVYFKLGFRFIVFDDLYRYDKDLYEKTWPLLTGGETLDVYGFAYNPQPNMAWSVSDMDSTDSNVTFVMDDIVQTMKTIDLVTGVMEHKLYSANNFKFAFSSEYFAIKGINGDGDMVFSVTPPEGVRYLETEMTITWINSKQAITNKDLAITIPIVWSNLSIYEANNPVVIGVYASRGADQMLVDTQVIYSTQLFDLPTQSEVLDLINYDNFNAILDNGIEENLKYSSIQGYSGVTDLTGLQVVSSTNYFFDLTRREYQMNVEGVKDASGNVSTMTYSAFYGDKFNLANIESEVVDATSGDFEIYNGIGTVLTHSTGETEDIQRDVYGNIDYRFAQSLLNGDEVYTAEYADDSMDITFNYTGFGKAISETVTVRKGTVPTQDHYLTDDVKALIATDDFALTSVTPEFSSRDYSSEYELKYSVALETYDINFVLPNAYVDVDNDGTYAREDYTIETSTQTEGFILYPNAQQIPDGYKLSSGNKIVWYTDENATNKFDVANIDTLTNNGENELTLYAGNVAPITATVVYNGYSNAPAKTFTFGEEYGDFWVPTVQSGQYLEGWLDASVNGSLVSANTVYEGMVDGETITLYASIKNQKAYSISNIQSNEVTYNQAGHTAKSFTVNYVDVNGNPSTHVVTGLDGVLPNTNVNGVEVRYKVLYKRNEATEAPATSLEFVNAAPTEGGTYIANIEFSLWDVSGSTPTEITDPEELKVQQYLTHKMAVGTGTANAQVLKINPYYIDLSVFATNALTSSGPNVFSSGARMFSGSGAELTTENYPGLVLEYGFTHKTNPTSASDYTWQDSPQFHAGYNRDVFSVIRIDETSCANYTSTYPGTSGTFTRPASTTTGIMSQSLSAHPDTMNLQAKVWLEVKGGGSAAGTDEQLKFRIEKHGNVSYYPLGMFQDGNSYYPGTVLNYNFSEDKHYGVDDNKDYLFPVKSNSGVQLLIEPWMINKSKIWVIETGHNNQLEYDLFELRMYDEDDYFNRVILAENGKLKYDDNNYSLGNIDKTYTSNDFGREIYMSNIDYTKVTNTSSEFSLRVNQLVNEPKNGTYNPYHYGDAPVLAVTCAQGSIFDSFVSYDAMNQVSIDKDGAKELAKKLGTPNLTFTVKLNFPATTTKGQNSFTLETVNVTW